MANATTPEVSTSKGNGASPSHARDTGALRLEVRPDGIGLITYDVPGASVNSLHANFVAEFDEMLDRVESDASIRAVVLQSGKADSFIVGANIDMLKAVRTASDAEALSRSGQRGCARLASAKKPIVAAIHGPALGGGFEVALACHARVCTDDKKTAFGFPEIQLGLLPGANGLQRFAEIVGLSAALDHGLTGKNLRAKKAKALSVVDEVVPKALLLEVACQHARALADKPKKPLSFLAKLEKQGGAAALQTLALEANPVGRRVLFKKARQLTQKKTKGHYPAAFAIIDVLETFGGRGFDASADVEARAFGELVVSETARQLMGIFFATQELKKDTGVANPNVKPREVKKVGMIGAGLMGAGIAYVSANAGVPVRLKDRDDESLGKGLAYVDKILGGRVKKKSLSRIEKDQVEALVTGTTGFEGFGRCDLVVEAVFEDLALKHRVVREAEAKLGPDAIFASNASSLPIGKIAEASARPQNVVGMHYFSPVEKMPLLEVIRHKGSSDDAVATAVALGKKQGKTVIVVNDGPGFYTTRILAPYMNEAAHLLSEGVPVEVIDDALVDWGFPVGPMTLLDEVGMDVGAHVAKVLFEAFGERMTPPAGTDKLVADGRKGRKNRRGVYLYDDKGNRVKDGKTRGVDASVYGVLGISPTTKLPVEEIQMRLVLAFVNEALRCLGEGILRSPRDGDIGAIFGLGFPPFRGGPFRYVDSIGPAEILRRTEQYRDRFGARFEPAPTLVNLAKNNGRFYR
ncbi:MAG: fatty acid oxidation complex subunit alpha FadJ [Deltaproteobacteria bacterium]|nr:fatty acid oxidation complex subunit alpha FadJ [Deltaproteobacteria bacterium]